MKSAAERTLSIPGIDPQPQRNRAAPRRPKATDIRSCSHAWGAGGPIPGPACQDCINAAARKQLEQLK